MTLKSSDTFKNFFPWKFWAPRYWGTWALLGTLKTIAALPFRVQLLMAKALSPVIFKWVKSRRRVTEINLQKVFPGRSEAEYESLAKRNFASFVRGAFESNFTYWANPKRFSKVLHLEVKGVEHLKAAIETGKGVILCGYHFHLVDVACRAMAECVHDISDRKIAVAYQPNKNPLVDRFLFGWRRAYNDDVFRRKELKKMLSWLKEGQVLLYAPDQDLGPGPSVFAPFMGVSSATVTATSRLVERTGAILLPGLYVREKEGCRIELFPPLPDYPSGDLTQDATALNDFFSKWIERYPDQYLWQHRRFKTRPMGEASFYD